MNADISQSLSYAPIAFEYGSFIQEDNNQMVICSSSSTDLGSTQEEVTHY